MKFDWNSLPALVPEPFLMYWRFVGIVTTQLVYAFSDDAVTYSFSTESCIRTALTASGPAVQPEAITSLKLSITTEVGGCARVRSGWTEPESSARMMPVAKLSSTVGSTPTIAPPCTLISVALPNRPPDRPLICVLFLPAVALVT